MLINNNYVQDTQPINKVNKGTNWNLEAVIDSLYGDVFLRDNSLMMTLKHLQFLIIGKDKKLCFYWAIVYVDFVL